jgi:formylglycine-generating enzyme required for sulfatase activity
VVAAVNMNQDAKQSDFDPYHKWLGIPPEEQPPNHYRLLGLQLFESDTEVILGAVMRQSAHLKTYQLGPHSALTQKLLNEVSAAKVSLMDPQRKAAYDARLRKELKTRKAPARPQTLPVAKPLAGPASLPSPDAPLPSASPTISTPVAPAEPAVESGLAELFNQIDGNVALSHPKAKKPASARDAVKGRRPNARGWLVAGGAAIVAGGIFAAMLIMRMRDKEGNVVAEMQVPAGGTVEVAEKGGRAGGTAGSSGSARPSPIPNPKSEISNSRSEISNPRSGISNSKSEIPPLAVAPFDEKKAKEYQETWAKHLGVPVEVTNAVGMKLVLIPPGEFEMGSTPEEIEWASPDKWYYNRAPAEAPRHHVKITRAFYMAAYPVTQGEYEKVMGVNPSAFTEKQVDVSTFKPPLDRGQIEEREKKAKKVAGRDTSRYPVETVNWDEATEFCRTLSAAPAERTSQLAYRLPTDAEWEYACRSGTTTRWYSGDDESDLQDYAWFGQNSSGMTHPVGKKKPNAWGLYDMHGNVCQWCSDRYGGYMQSPVSDPKGPPSGDARVLRGGFWSAINCRSASRHWNLPAERSRITPGFRVVAEVAVEEQEQPTAPATPSNAGNSNAPAPAIAPFGEAKAKEHQEAWAKHLGVPVEMANSIGMKLVLIPPGEFMMGEGGDAHKVAITKAFYLGSYVVTQEQWQTVMGSNPSESKNTAPKNPVGRVTWEDCQEFLRRLGETPGAARASYNLPTEAQWEYACRAGSASRYCFGDSDAELGEYAWYRENSGHQMHPVGAKKPNAWGLFDMHGNVNEWCADWYDEGYYRASPGIDPAGPSGGERRARRGGGFDFPAGDCRSAFRYGSKPGVHFGDLGLRVSQVLPDQPGEPHKPAPRIETRESADLSKAKPAEADLHAGKIAPPSAQEQKRLIQTIDEAYKSEAAKDRTAQIALAQKLLEDGRKNDANRAEQFVMLRRSGEIARDAGAADLMLEAVDAMAQAGFDIKPLSIKARLLTQLLEQDPPAGLPQRCDLGLSCARFAEEAAAGGAADEASEVLQAAHDSLAKARKGVQQALQRARTASARARNPADKAAREKEVQQTQEQLGAADSALAAVAESSKGLRQLQRDGEALHAAREQLKTTPDDAEASLTVGRWQCFNEGDWDSGLKLLAQGSDGALKSLAAEELTAKPAKAEDKAARGDAWWDAAGKAAGRDKSGMRGRAAYWYQEAVGELSPGLAKLKLEKRLAQMAEDKSPQPAGSAKIRPPLAVAPFDEKTAVLHQKRWGKYLRAPVVQTNSIGMKLVLIPPGEFMMGSPKELIQEELNTPNIPNWDKERLSNEGPSHRVRITHPFYFGLYEVTQEEYQRVMGWNHSEYSASGRERDKVAGLDTTRFPVENLEWRDAAEFCQKLSELPEEKAAGRSYHLPSEAQWEYACRAGTTGRYSFSPNGSDIPKKLDEDALADYGWFSGNSGGMVHPVGQKKPNAWGLYDMHGNVWEWCQDFRDATGASYYAGSPVDDPGGPGGGQHDINRGGSFTGPARLCRSANRGHNGPGWGCEHGMRACMVLTGK